MKSSIIALLGLLSPFLFNPEVKAANPDHIQQLLSTRECQGCDLSGADLTAAHLIGVDLRDANLKGANLTEANLEGLVSSLAFLYYP
ncbi:Pentapeptide repeat [Crocosphaera watsonii WH 0402]|uniref:Pentapeptide repeat n=1 Tax=Crocosphaera watsonii WH 0402 TaxID=1284629 RepID=T2JWD7_CROWT|nr:Pentapeptide repeat [Crocosphaera watsonii WH 0402]